MSHPDPLEAFLRAMPKAELHCHLLGTVRRDTFTHLVRRERAPISDAEIEAFYTRGEKPVGVLRVLRALDQDLIRSADDLHRLTYEYLQDAAAHSVRYAEFFWNPTGTAEVSGLPYARAVEGIVRAKQDRLPAVPRHRRLDLDLLVRPAGRREPGLHRAAAAGGKA